VGIELKTKTLDSIAGFRVWLPAVFVPALFVAGLLAYKWNAAFLAIQKVWSSGALSLRPDVVAFGGGTSFMVAKHSLNYLAVIWPALTFGILIGAAVRAFVPPEWFARSLSGTPLRAQAAAGVAGAPLMLCSCCVAPVFSAMYERSSRLGPSLAVMLASPSLNPAALFLTFLLFAPKVAAARLLMAAVTVFLGGVVIERLFTRGSPVFFNRKRTEFRAPAGLQETASAFFGSLLYILVRTVPALVLGVVSSMLLIQYVPPGLLASSGFRFFSVLAAASIAVPLALPTFFEVPLSLAFLSAGAPLGAVAAFLFAGPAVNLPSLLALAKSTNWKIATVLAVLVWIVAATGGLLVNLSAPH
jgi:hypothetical protein